MRDAHRVGRWESPVSSRRPPAPFSKLRRRVARSGKRCANQVIRKQRCSRLRARPNLRRIRWTPRDWARRSRRSTALWRLLSLFDGRSSRRRTSPKPEVAIGMCLRQTGELQLARVELERAVALRPNDGRAWFVLGLVCEDLRDTLGGIEAYRRSIDVQPDVPEAQVNLGLNLQNAGDVDAAMDSYRRAMRLRPDTFGRIGQALTSAKKGSLWLSLARLRRLLEA